MFQPETSGLKIKKQAPTTRQGVLTLRGLGPLSLPTHVPQFMYNTPFRIHKIHGDPSWAWATGN